jgi:xylan 1,4-beta-xylosidase
MRRRTLLVLLVCGMLGACTGSPDQTTTPAPSPISTQLPATPTAPPSPTLTQTLPATPTDLPLPSPTPTVLLAATPPESIRWTLRLTDPSGIIRPLLGVNVGPMAALPSYADLTEAYHAMGVTAIRTHDYYGPFDMWTLYPDQDADPADPASYNFEASDRVFAAIIEGGFEPYIRIGNSWRDDMSVQRMPYNPQNWTQAVVEVVRHFNDPAQWGTSAVRYVEIWNEPDTERFWDGTPEEFYRLYVNTAQALKSAFPDLKVGGPGVAPGGYFDPAGQAFVDGFLRYVAAENAPLDFFSWHMYNNEPQVYADAARAYRQKLDSLGFVDTESHITEWNTELSRIAYQSEALAMRAGGPGASVLTAAWIALQEQAVDASYFYRGTDRLASQPTGYGMYYTDGRPKHVALAFHFWAQIADYSQKLAVNTGGAPLWVLAGTNAQGETAILVANPSSEATSWQVIGLEDAESPAIVLQEVNDSSAAILTYELPQPAAVIGPYTVQYLTLTP